MLYFQIIYFLCVPELGVPLSIQILGWIHVSGYLPKSRPIVFIAR